MACAPARKRTGDLRRQVVVAFEGEQLPDLHGGAAQAGEAARETLGIGARHKDVADLAAAAEQTSCTLDDTTQRDLTGEPADARQAFKAARRHARTAGVLRRVRVK